MELYSTFVLNRVVESMLRTPAFLLNSFFPSIAQSETEEIYFDVVMDVDAFRLFKDGMKETGSINDLLDLRRGNPQALMDTTIAAQVGAQYVGTDGKHRYWVYSDWYVDPADNTEKPVLPSNTVLVGGQGIEGVRHFGAIRDEAAGYQARESFTKSWVEQDPAVRYIMMQSAPLLVPYRKDAMVCATVA